MGIFWCSVDSYNVGNSLINIGDGVFYYCLKIQEVTAQKFGKNSKR